MSPMSACCSNFPFCDHEQSTLYMQSLSTPTPPPNPYARFAKEENEFLNAILSDYFKRPVKDEDVEKITMIFRQKDKNGFDKYDSYDLAYNGKVIGVVKKQILFGKFKIKFLKAPAP